MSRDIAAVVRSELVKRQWSDAGLARRAGLPKANLSRKLAGGSKFFIDDAAAIADAFGWTLATLMRRAEAHQEESPEDVAAAVLSPLTDQERAEIAAARAALEADDLGKRRRRSRP